MTNPFLSIIIPAFNENARIIATLKEIVDYLKEQCYTWEVLVVDDGSSDQTMSIVREWILNNTGVRLKAIPHAGKGWAVKHGMQAADGEYRFMCDADLPISINTIETFLNQINEGYDIVIGSRQIPGAQRFNEPLFRHIMGRLFNWSLKCLAFGGFQDTQCGFKCFRGDVADELFALQKTKGWSFDVEILYLALKRKKKVLELPIAWYHQESSKVKPYIDPFLMIRDISLVRWHALRGQYGIATQGKAETTSDAPFSDNHLR